MNNKEWYKEAVVYQIYPKSFCDSDGDGIGDIKGIISKLDYLRELGVNTVWLSPCYMSPGYDNGYDISDYRMIDPVYGTMDDFALMLDEMHKRGIRLLMDLVVNHTSDQHKWFKESKKGKDNPYRDYYIWKDKVDGHEPNAWRSGFAGSAWEWDEDSEQYYLHLYTKQQPDLNWENPKVREEIADMINWWLDMGVDGFRCDVINQIAKDFNDPHAGDAPWLHDYLHFLNEKCFKPHHAMTVGEVWDLTPEQSLDLTAPEREELSIVFQFEHISIGREGKRFYLCPFNPNEFFGILSKWQNGLKGRGWNALVNENHDQARSVNRFGSLKYRYESATMLATMLYGMQGTPFIFEGQEIGMINPTFKKREDCIDIESTVGYDEMMKEFDEAEVLRRISSDARDCGRSPMVWDDSKNAGFTAGKPWLIQIDEYKEINVKKDLASEKSVFAYYQKLISLHKENKSFLYGDYNEIYNQNCICAYQRAGDDGSYTVLCNFSENHVENPYTIDKDRIVLSNYTEHSDILMPYEAVIFKN